MATAAAGEDQKETECAVCHGDFTDPKILPCAHLLCRDCLVTWLKSDKENQCPLCRCAILDPGDHASKSCEDIADALPTDLAMVWLVESVRILNKAHVCAACVGVAATNLCIHCGDMLCQSCTNIHARMSGTRHHTVEILTSLTPERLSARRPASCSVHSDRQPELFCPAHGVSVCLLCAMSDHQSCRKERLETRVKESCAVLDQLVATLTEGEKGLERAISQLDQHLVDMDKNTQASLAEIDAAYDRLETSLQAWRRRLREIIKGDNSDAEANVNGRKVVLLERREKLTSHRRLAQRVKQTTPPSSMDEMSSQLKTQVAGLDHSTFLPEDVKRVKVKKLTLDPQALTRIEKELDSLGQLTSDTPFTSAMPGLTQTQKLCMQFQGILNKLTPQNAHKLAEQALALEINTEEELVKVTDLLFEKALSEPNVSVAYADLSKRMLNLKVPCASDPKSFIQFRALLLTKCQREFENYNKREPELASRKKAASEMPDGDEKKALERQIEVDTHQAHRRSAGNIRFIGELFKLKMLTENVMHDCIFMMLRARDAEHLECLCHLLTSIGRVLDTPRAKPRMDQYFLHLKKLAFDETLVPEARIRFMMRDVIELRDDFKWKQGKNQKNKLTEDCPGWNAIQTRNMRQLDASRMKLSRQNVDDSIQLGPGGGSKFSNWHMGSLQEKEKPGGKSNLHSPGGQDRSNSASHVCTREIKPEPSAAVAGSSPDALQMSADLFEKRIKNIVEEFLHKLDFKEATDCVAEWRNLNHKELVTAMINVVLERSSQARLHVGELLFHLTSKKIITVKSLVDGILDVMEFAEDIEIGVPKIYEYLGELFGPMILDNVALPLTFLRSAVEPLIQSGNGKAAPVLYQALHVACQRKPKSHVRAQFKASRLKVSDFVPADKVNDFIKQKELDWLIQEFEDSAPAATCARPAAGWVEDQLVRLLQSHGTDNERIFDFIEANVSEEDQRSHQFIRELVTAVCRNAISGDNASTYKVNVPAIQLRRSLMLKYLENNPELELQALYALQHLMCKMEHPPGILKALFDVLFDEEIISEESFYAWKDGDHPTEQKGRGVALMSANAFYAWLRDGEES